MKPVQFWFDFASTYFAHDRDISEPAVLGEILEAMGQDRDRLLALAVSPGTKERLRSQTERAWEAGIFGAPSFLVDGELFWGHDRMEQALRWARRPAAKGGGR